MLLHLYSFFIILFASPAYLHYIDPTTRISLALNEYIRTGIKPKSLDNAVSSLRNLLNETYQNEQICQTCKYVVDGFLQYRRSGVKKELMVKLAEKLCLVFNNWNKDTCKGLINIEIDPALYMIDNRKNLTADRVCAIYLQTSLCKDPGYVDWNINIPKEINNTHANNETEVVDIETLNDTLKILHLTDVHFDPHYIPGSNAKCDAPLCCRGEYPEKPENAAGFWGDYNVCDMPWHAVLNLMDQIINQHQQVDYIYYTGDVLHHASWLTTRESNLNDIKRLFDLLLETFNSIPVYPILGNHESHPSDFYSTSNVNLNLSTNWLFDSMAEEWSKWLPEDTKRTIKIGGYYTVLVKKGFRIIALNSNVCYIANLWLVYDDVDPYGQLQWLADTLVEAEKNNEVVHILSHVPPGSIECWQKWSTQFNKIVNRFSKTIKAHFNGHTHLDEIRIILNDDQDNAINVAYNGGSFTAFVGMNPNYRIYDMDSATYQITDYVNWMLNLTEANKNIGLPVKWYKLYSFKEAYGLNTTNMEDLFDLVQRMKNDPQKEILKQYFKFQFRESAVHVDKGCDENCLDKLLCYITNTNFEDAIKC